MPNKLRLSDNDLVACHSQRPDKKKEAPKSRPDFDSGSKYLHSEENSLAVGTTRDMSLDA